MTQTPTPPRLTPPSDTRESRLSQRLVILENTPPRTKHPLVRPEEEKQGNGEMRIALKVVLGTILINAICASVLCYFVVGGVHFLLSSAFVFLFLSMVGFPASLAVFTDMKEKAGNRHASESQLQRKSSCSNQCEQCSHRTDGGSCTDEHEVNSG
ncbi:MAG: hypothetical protein P8J45_04575 [Phycisphaerales bacterium]|nr:hypothetical protein [Phycisphaerales bacterium]